MSVSSCSAIKGFSVGVVLVVVGRGLCRVMVTQSVSEDCVVCGGMCEWGKGSGGRGGRGRLGGSRGMPGVRVRVPVAVIEA